MTVAHIPIFVVVGYTDENGSVFVNTFDALSRKIATAITRATAVIGTTAQSFQYDGLSRRTQAIDDAGTNAEVDFAYDSLGRVLEETQIYGATRNTTHTAFQSYPATQVTYPTGDITLANGYDALYRRNSAAGASATYGALDAVGWQFFGPRRVVETNWGGGSLIATQMNNARTHAAVQATVPLPAWGNISSDQLGYDGAGRMITKRYLTGGIDGGTFAYSNTTALVGYTTAYDRAGNKLYERHLEAESRSHLYQPFNADGSFALGYDSANRLLQFQRGVLSSAIIPFRVNPGASITTPITLPGMTQNRTFVLDGLGNWKTANYTGVGSSPTTEVRQHNYVNQNTSTTDTTGSSSSTFNFTYDHGNNTDGVQGNGNQTYDGYCLYEYDALNRVTLIREAGSEVILVSYVYDALNRRIQKAINDLGSGYGGLTGNIPAVTTDYLYDGQQIIEQRDDATDTWIQVSFWGRYIDELLFMSVPGESAPTTYRLLSDLLYRSTALTDTSNNVVEAYDTDAYGFTLCYSGSGTDGLWFTDDDVQTDNPINANIFTGRQYDPETQIYYFRARYYIAQFGRFISRDLLQNAELIQGPNLYWYVQDNPVNAVDPSGLDCCNGIYFECCIYEANTALGLTQGLAPLAGNVYDLDALSLGVSLADDSPGTIGGSFILPIVRFFGTEAEDVGTLGVGTGLDIWLGTDEHTLKSQLEQILAAVNAYNICKEGALDPQWCCRLDKAEAIMDRVTAAVNEANSKL